jgi:ABC-type nitrate/sulfonate/bicarbonate transport system permease component
MAVTQVGTAPAPRRSLGAGRPRWVGGLVGVAALVAVWWLLAVTVFAVNGAVPTPAAMVARMVDDGWEFYSPHVTATVAEALQGFLWGNALALAVALLVLLVPPLEGLAMQVAVISYCIPLIAIGPIIKIVFGGRTPMVFLAAISVFFTTVVGALLGLRAADRASLDVVTAYGGGRWKQLTKVQLIASIPGVLAALKIAAPAALLGAIIGEYLGGIDTGLGVAMTIAQQQYEVARVWGLALVAGLLAGVAYAVIALVARFAAPWSSGTAGQEGR